MLCRTSSQICGRWYLPTFLLRDGLFALIYRASLINLIRFRSSLFQDGKVVNSDSMTRDVGMVMYGGRGLEMFFEPIFKISGWLPYIFMITVRTQTTLNHSWPVVITSATNGNNICLWHSLPGGYNIYHKKKVDLPSTTCKMAITSATCSIWYQFQWGQ